MARGKLICGSRTDLLGFGYLDANGRNVGFDIDLCRAVAVALFNDTEAVEFVPLTAAERGPALQRSMSPLTLFPHGPGNRDFPDKIPIT